jgi:hypothetical protein
MMCIVSAQIVRRLSRKHLTPGSVYESDSEERRRAATEGDRIDGNIVNSDQY